MVRGITNFVKMSDNLLRPYKLQDTYLIIDGKNVSFQLFCNQSVNSDFFNGDYNSYARCVTMFFEALLKCNITPIVVFDGNNEEKNLPMNYDRYSDRLRNVAIYTPTLGGVEDGFVYPLFLRTVFTDIIHELHVLVYRCDFTADNAIANLARELKCPVLSQDSDYYIYDVLYVPFNSLKVVPQKSQTNQFYLACNLYSCTYFLNSYPGLRWEHMPLLATVSGGNIIESEVFERFYNRLGKQKGRAARMRHTINYLRNKSFEEAVTQVLDSVGGRQMLDLGLLIAKNILCYKYNKSSIPKVLELKNFEVDETLKMDTCATLDILVAKVFKNYFKVDIFEEDRQKDTLQSLISNVQSLSIAGTNTGKLPDWFLQKNRICSYHAPVFEIANSFVYFLPAVLEDFSMMSVHSISFKIIAAMYKITSQTINGKDTPISVAGRQDSRPTIRRFELDTYNKDVVCLEDIPNLSKETRCDVLFDILDLQSERKALLSEMAELPSDWHLFLWCVIYWNKNAKYAISDKHLCALYLCIINIKVVDDVHVGSGRSLDNFLSKYSELFDDGKWPGLAQPSECTTHDDDLLQNTPKRALALRDLKTKFNYNRNTTFNRRVVHAFGELKSCTFYINALNSLLDEPLDKIRLAEIYNETFLQNVHHDLCSTAENVNVALEAMLSKMSNN